MADEKQNPWKQPATIFAVVQLAAGLAPTILKLVRRDPDTQKIIIPTLEQLLALGWSIDEATAEIERLLAEQEKEP